MSIPHSTKSTKLALALAAEQSLKRLVEFTGVDCSREAAISNLITDLGHYCDVTDLPFLALLESGLSRWIAEKDNPFTEADGPVVTITINQGKQPM